MKAWLPLIDDAIAAILRSNIKACATIRLKLGSLGEIDNVHKLSKRPLYFSLSAEPDLNI